MLPETPIDLRQAMVIGLGNVGKTTVDKLDGLLRERLGSVPIVGLVTLEPDYAMSASEIDVQETASYWHVRLPMAGDTGDVVPSSQRLGARPVSQHKPDTGVLDTTSDPTQVRRNGRQAIRRWCNSLQKLLGTVQGSIRTQDNLTTVRQRTDLRMQVDETGLEVFLIAALDEPFASGAFLDLTYLIDHILAFEGGGRFHYHTSGVLFLPNYLLDGADMDVREADTYAALKELDYYTSQRSYASDFRNPLDFMRSGLPFNRSCYLIETTNNEHRSLPELDQLSAMVSEWLYRYLTSPLATCFREHGSDFANRTSEGRVTAYSGLGIASFVLPVDAAIEVCGARLGKEIVRNHLQREARGKEEKTEPMGLAQTYTGDPVSKWLEATLRATDAVRSFLDLAPGYFDNINLWDFKGLRERLLFVFGVQKLSQSLPSIKRDLQEGAEGTLERVRQHLPAEIKRIIDDRPDGGLDRAQIFLETLHGAMADRESTARTQAKQAHELYKAAGDDIARARAHYQSATQMTHPQAILGMLLACIVVVGSMVYAWRVFFNVLPWLELEVLGRRLLDFGDTNVIAGVLVIMGHLISVGIVAVATRDWMRGTKDLYINRHRYRLAHSLEKVQQDLQARFYRNMQDLVNDEIVRLTDFRDLIDQVGNALQEETERPRLLHETLHFPLEESVLTPSDLEAFYREIIRAGTEAETDDLNDFVLKLMRTHGPLSTWARCEVEDLCTRIIQFGKDQMEALRRRKSAEQILIAHLEGPAISDDDRIDVQIALAESPTQAKPSLIELPPLPKEKHEALRKRAAELHTRSQPFLRYEKTQIQSDSDVPTICLLGTLSADAGATPLNRVMSEYFGDVQRVATNDPHTLVVMSVRHGLPLYALGMARRYRSKYERCFRDKLLHTRRAHLALPDLFPLKEDALEPQMAVALGCAVKPPRSRATIIRHDPASGYFFVHQQARRAPVNVLLGKDKLDASIYLQHNANDLVRLSKQIDETIVKRAEAAKSGNRAVIRALEKYLKDNADQLEEWEVVMIERYIERLQ